MKGRVFICKAPPTRTIIDETGKKWHFEMHAYCGPMPCTKDGDGLKNDPPANSSFWRVVTWWHNQGQRVGEDGLCVWEKKNEKFHVQTEN